jgi:hypothetical protein
MPLLFKKVHTLSEQSSINYISNRSSTKPYQKKKFNKATEWAVRHLSLITDLKNMMIPYLVLEFVGGIRRRIPGLQELHQAMNLRPLG